MQLPIGIDDFRTLIDNQLTFVDKTLFIKELIDDRGTIVPVIPRPRRFGKTLNLSMLRHFFAAEVDGRPTQGLFDHLNIAKVEGNYLQYQGQYPVIFLTLKEIKALRFLDAIKVFRVLIQDLYRSYQYLLDSQKLSVIDKKLITRITDNDQSDKSDLEVSLKRLSELLYKHHGQKVYVLVDEYDTPIQASFLNGYYDEMVGFTRNLLSAVLKTNPYLEKGVVTGVIRIAKESLFSGLNNVETYSIFQDKYSQYFGFTEPEVEGLLKQGHMENQLEEVKRWYNGYQFGNTVIYNPWSIVNCVNKKKIQPYWVNTSDSGLIKRLIIQSPLEFKEKVEKLLQGECIRSIIDEHVVFGDLTHNPGAIWSLLVTAGYLKPLSAESTEQGYACQLCIPNQEIRTVYRQLLERWLSEKRDINWYNDFIESLLTGNIEDFSKHLTIIMEQIVGIHDVAKEPEAFYHGLMLGFTASLSKDQYEIQSNREGGLGRFDILLVPKDPQKLGIILELKAVKLPSKLPSKNTQEFIDQLLENEAKTALKQIQDKRYVQELAGRGVQKSVAIGLAFSGKCFQVVAEK